MVQTVKNLPAMLETRRSIPGLERSPEEGNGNSLRYSCLDSSMDKGAWWATVHRVAKSQTQLKRHSTHAAAPHKAAVRFIGKRYKYPYLEICSVLRLCFSPVYNPSVVPYFHLSTRQTPAQPSELGSWVCFSGSPGKLI